MSETVSTQKRTIATTVGFSLTDRKIPQEHNFQFYVDYGTTEKGPWLKLGINDTEYGIGFLPQPKSSVTQLHPAT